MKRLWKFLAARWPDDATEAALPTEGAAGTYVPTLNTTSQKVAWAQVPGSPGAEILVDDASGEVLIDDETGNVLYEG